jgi:Lamin Tail Domain
LYTHEFIELFNPTDEAISLAGWSVQYASATGTGNFAPDAQQITPLSGALQPGQYLLIDQLLRGRGRTAVQIMRQAHLSGDALELLRCRIVLVSLFAWLPLLILEVWGGRVGGAVVRVPFLLDIEVHVRFLVALPCSSLRSWWCINVPWSSRPKSRCHRCSVSRDRQNGGRGLLTGIRQRHDDQEEREDPF